MCTPIVHSTQVVSVETTTWNLMYGLLHSSNFGTNYVLCMHNLILITWLKQSRLDWHLRHSKMVVSLPPHYFPESRKTSPVIVVSTTYTYSFSLSRHTLLLSPDNPFSVLWFPNIKSSYTTLGPLQESCECTFQLSLHAIIIQPHCEPHPQATYLLALLLQHMKEADIDNLYSWETFSIYYPNGHRPS